MVQVAAGRHVAAALAVARSAGRSPTDGRSLATTNPRARLPSASRSASRRARPAAPLEDPEMDVAAPFLFLLPFLDLHGAYRSDSPVFSSISASNAEQALIAPSP